MKKPTAKQLELLREMVAVGPVVEREYWWRGNVTVTLTLGDARRVSRVQLSALIARGLAERVGRRVKAVSETARYIPTDAGRQLIAQETQA